MYLFQYRCKNWRSLVWRLWSVFAVTQLIWWIPTGTLDGDCGVFCAAQPESQGHSPLHSVPSVRPLYQLCGIWIEPSPFVKHRPGQIHWTVVTGTTRSTSVHGQTAKYCNYLLPTSQMVLGFHNDRGGQCMKCLLYTNLFTPYLFIDFLVITIINLCVRDKFWLKTFH